MPRLGLLPRISLSRSRVDLVGVEPNLVVDLAFLVVRQHVVSLGDFLELLLSLLVVGVHIGVIFARKLAKRLANLIRSRRLFHAQRAVIIFVLCRCHDCFTLVSRVPDVAQGWIFECSWL